MRLRGSEAADTTGIENVARDGEAISDVQASPELKNTDCLDEGNLPIYRQSGRALGVSFQHLNVFGPSGGEARIPDFAEVFSSILQYPAKLVHGTISQKPRRLKQILHDVTGVVNPGECLLVLGRPGSGCSSTLKALANDTSSFSKTTGEITYSGMASEDMKRFYGSEIVYNAEDDIHFPKLTVQDSLKFGLALRKPASCKDHDGEFSQILTDKILASLGIEHTKTSIVGNAFVRGVSGGERKRVSLAEVLSAGPAVVSWDNPIRGLDSSSALSFLELLKKMSSTTGMSNIVTLYQASEAMYQNCFDRVMVLYSGRMIFFGRVEHAKQYFIDLGFKCPDRQTTPDFLTSITSPEGRQVREDHLGPVPRHPDEFAEAFTNHPLYSQLLLEIERYRDRFTADSQNAVDFRAEVDRTKHKTSLKMCPEIRSIPRQTLVACRRHYQILWGDRKTVYTVILIGAVNAVVNGSAYYMAPRTATGSFEKGGALFFSLIYFFLTALTEVSSTINSRQILLKQHKLGMIHPAAYALAQTLADIPVSLLQALIFCCIYYFMLGLASSASAFWVFTLFVFVNYGAVSSLFRMLGAWSPNLSIGFLMSGVSIPICLLYSGYGPQRPTTPGWGAWIRYISPTPYALEALMANEFTRISLECTPSQMIPHGPGYTEQRFQGCPLSGVSKGSTTVAGEIYLEQEYQFLPSHIWRNFGIMVSMWAIYTLLSAVGLTIMTRDGSSAGGRTYKSSALKKMSNADIELHQEDRAADLEKQGGSNASGEILSSDSEMSSKESVSLQGTDSSSANSEYRSPEVQGRAFTFENVTYTVNGKDLLDKVSGYVKPGQLTALMGASGAGKTTLLDVLAQRKSEGVVGGRMFFNGKELDNSFGRSCSFCMQQDVHEPTATVREALQFSARLRQPYHVAEDDKLEYVEHIISLLELGPIAEALIGTPGEGGLGVEERKRVTIGVELAARPSGLLFLDEPTSGLDSEAAFSLVSLLRRIAADGVPIICTIHQPSGVLFEMFDHILLLAPGGKTVYFGELGQNSQSLVRYFARQGVVIGDHVNPAEFTLSTVTSKGPDALDWGKIWLSSPEYNELQQRLLSLHNSQSASSDPTNAGLSPGEFATPILFQIMMVTKRHWIAVWRNGFYNFSRVTKAVLTTLFIAFTYYKAGSDAQGLQNHMLFMLIFSWIVPATASDIQDIWFEKWAIFEARERNGLYNYKALAFALIVVEIPWQLLSLTLAFFSSYWTVGFRNESTIAGFQYFMYILLGLFGSSFPQMLASIFPNAALVGFANSFTWVILMDFSGTLILHLSMNTFYRPWLFWADPMRYWLGGSSSNVLHDVKARCSAKDLVLFDPPGQDTCIGYMTDFLSTNPGYLENPNSTADCAYCPYQTGDDLLARFSFQYQDRWRDLAVFFGFCVTTMLLTLLITWFTRSRRKKVVSQ